MKNKYFKKKRQFCFITEENIDEINEELTRRKFEIENNEAEEFIERQIPEHQMVDIFTKTKANAKKTQISNTLIEKSLCVEKNTFLRQKNEYFLAQK